MYSTVKAHCPFQSWIKIDEVRSITVTMNITNNIYALYKWMRSNMYPWQLQYTYRCHAASKRIHHVTKERRIKKTLF